MRLKALIKFIENRIDNWRAKPSEHITISSDSLEPLEPKSLVSENYV